MKKLTKKLKLEIYNKIKELKINNEDDLSKLLYETFDLSYSTTTKLEGELRRVKCENGLCRYVIDFSIVDSKIENLKNEFKKEDELKIVNKWKTKPEEEFELSFNDDNGIYTYNYTSENSKIESKYENEKVTAYHVSTPSISSRTGRPAKEESWILFDKDKNVLFHTWSKRPDHKLSLKYWKSLILEYTK